MRADASRPQFDFEHATRWCDADAAHSYRNRPPYPEGVFAALEGLIGDDRPVILDIGCGTGKICRRLSSAAARVDAIDLSSAMIEEARRLPGGDADNFVWQVGRAEAAVFDPPYALAVAGESLHWMDHHVLLPRLARALTPQGVLAIANIDDSAPAPWREGFASIVQRYSTAKDYVPFDMLRVWQEAGIYSPLGEYDTGPVPFTQPVEDFIDAQHAMSSLTRAKIDAVAFDAEMRDVLKPYCPDGLMTRTIRGKLAWGRPHAAATS